MMFKHVTLKYKILMMLILEIIALLLLFFVSQFFMGRNMTLLAHIETNFVPALELGYNLEQRLTEIQRSMQDAVAATDQEMFSSTDSLYNEFLHMFEQGRTNLFFEAKKLDQLKTDFQEYYALARKNSFQLIEGRRLDEELVGDLEAMRTRYNAIKAQLQRKTIQAKEEVSASFSVALRNSQRSAIIMNLIILFCTILFGGSSLLLSRSITKPLRSLVNATYRIAQGDLTQKIVIHSNDELAVLGHAMERMRVELQQFYQELEHLVAERTQQLQESESRFRHVIASISDHIYMAELSDAEERRNLYISPKVEIITGYPAEKFLADPKFWPSLIVSEDRSTAMSQVARFLQGQDSEVEYRLVRADGDIIWVRDSGRVERQPHLNSITVYGVISNITERKRAEAKQLKLQGQLRKAQKLEAIGKLAGGTAHEFNNILAIMLGAIELVINKLPAVTPEKTKLEQAYKTGERGRDLVKQILIFSRSSQRKLQSLQLAPVLQNAIKMAQQLLPPMGRLRYHFEPISRLVLANPLQIDQVVVNLCKNAIQAMKNQKGTIEIRLDEIEYTTDLPELQASPDNTYVRLTVKDDGSGMPSDVKDRIFDPFFTTKEVGRGAGLGLSVVHGIVQQCGGRITVDSEIGKGTTFEILFPGVQETAQPEIPVGISSEQDREVSWEPLEKQHILIVADDPKGLRLPLMALEKLGYTITVVYKGSEALRRFRTDPQQFDLVLTDLTMSEMSGIQICQEIVNIRPDVPLIVCIEAHEFIESKMAEKIGVAKFFRKPLKVRQLIQTIREVLLVPLR